LISSLNVRVGSVFVQIFALCSDEPAASAGRLEFKRLDDSRSALSRRQLLVGGTALVGASLAGCNAAPRRRDLSSLALPPLAGLKRNGAQVGGLAGGELKHGVTVLVNWSSQCGACQHNHEFLQSIRDQRQFILAGVVTYDSQAKVRNFLEERGNPYDFVAFDAKHELLKLTRITAVPTTYIVDSKAQIHDTFIGSFSQRRLHDEFMPSLRKLINV
jgi:cytochrome c biogenesis protein CcmG, thiol:disulfide interchange protein DsbE